METCSALLTLCAGNSPVTGEFPAQRPVTRSFDIFFDLRLNKGLSKQSWGWLFETPSRSLWHHCNEWQPKRPPLKRYLDSLWPQGALWVRSTLVKSMSYRLLGAESFTWTNADLLWIKHLEANVTEIWLKYKDFLQGKCISYVACIVAAILCIPQCFNLILIPTVRGSHGVSVSMGMLGVVTELASTHLAHEYWFTSLYCRGFQFDLKYNIELTHYRWEMQLQT